MQARDRGHLAWRSCSEGRQKLLESGMVWERAGRFASMPGYVEENKESDDPDLFGVSVAIYFRGKSRWGRQELEAEFLRD